jgi:hypothetical protein
MASHDRSRRLALAVAAVAVLGVLAAAALVASSASESVRRASELLDKQQAAWWGAPHKDENGNWDEGWLARYVQRHRGARGRDQRQQLASVGGGEQAELDQIHGLLDKAVGMLGTIESGKKGQENILAGAGAPATKAHTDRMHTVKGEAARVLPGVGDEPMCFKLNGFSDMDRAKAIQRMSMAADNLAMSYPDWAKGAAIPGHGQDGEWRHDRGPPYVQRLTMYAGQGVDTLHNGNLVRRILGLNKAFQKPCDLRSCDEAFSGNQYVRSFDGSQFRFLYRNMCSTIVIPPLTKGAGPILGHNGLYRLHHYLKDSYNSLIVLGGTASILFLNQNVATLEGGYSLAPSWVDGPFEAQAAQGANTPFAALSATLPNPGVAVTGVKISSLPTNAISYYEAEDTSVVFEIPLGTGRIIYLGYDYSEPITPWVHALVAATMFNDYDFEGTPRREMQGSTNRWGDAGR